MTLTYRDLATVINACAYLVNEAVKTPALLAPEKFAYAVRKVKKSAEALYVGYTEQLEDLQIAYALEENGRLVRNDKGELQYSKNGITERNSSIRALSKQTVNLDPFLVPAASVPDLPWEVRDALIGLIIPDDEVK